MTRIERAVSAIGAAKTAIGSLVSQAGQEEKWDEASQFSDLGRKLQSLVDELTGNGTVTAQAGAPAVNVAAAAKGSKKAVYPQFFREGDSLVKVGWSKSQRTVYEHKSPKHVMDALVNCLLQIGARGQRFTMEKVVPLLDPAAGGAEIPGYQAYVCLAWLRHEGLVEQHGRSGYSIPKSGDLAKSAEICWDRLQLR